MAIKIIHELLFINKTYELTNRKCKCDKREMIAILEFKLTCMILKLRRDILLTRKRNLTKQFQTFLKEKH